MSVQAVADTCTNEIGYKLLRTTLANLESGSRRNITIAEISAIAAALRVPPAALLFPVDEPGPVEVLPGDYRSPFAGWLWFTDAALAIDMGLAWDATDPYMTFIEHLQANIGLAKSEAAWTVISRVIEKMTAMDMEGMEPVIDQTRRQRTKIAQEARPSFDFLTEKQLPIPKLSPDLEEAIRSVTPGAGLDHA
ncbi:hypothetical protein Arth_1348 [Arthrobacter sp. FB24]|nr:hypothetical protein Arth_1348 [Arthrobacter sp. FB24]